MFFFYITRSSKDYIISNRKFEALSKKKIRILYTNKKNFQKIVFKIKKTIVKPQLKNIKCRLSPSPIILKVEKENFTYTFRGHFLAIR